MRAIVFNEHGDESVLKQADLPEPAAARGRVVVALEAAGLNRLDLAIRKGLPGIRVSLPHTLGTEGYGRVHAVGPDVTHLKPGDPVVVTPGSSCGACEACAAGQDTLCRGYRMLGYQEPGCYAEMVDAPATSVYPAGPALTPVEWAAAPLVYLTVWRMLMTLAELRQGETVLVQAAGSGVGMAAVQIAGLMNAEIIATAGSDEKLAKARELGAHRIINYTTQDVAQQVRVMTDGRGVDVVVEHTGGATWEGSLRSLARGGRLVTCGATTEPVITMDLRHLFAKQFRLLGSYMGSRGELVEVLKLLNRGILKPVVDRAFPLAEAAEAHRYLDSRAQFGKVVLTRG